jgi:predicted SnoaL-like aldol condensation-catalyzing enzyme
MAEAIVENRKHSAVQFLKLVTAGRIDEAYQEYVDMKGKHHNCYFPAGFPALMKAMIDNHKQSPVKKYTVKNVIGDGNLVAVHAHLVLNQKGDGMVVVHLCRFEGDKIVEFWDCGQAIPAEMPNNDGAF